MKILDHQGRLFGKVSVLDVGAALVIVAVMVGIFFFPGPGRSAAQLNSQSQAVEVDLLVRGLNVKNSTELIQKFEGDRKTKIIIRNQPHGEVEVKSIRQLARLIPVPQPDGSVKALPDPRPDIFSNDILLTIASRAQVTKDGAVMAGNKVKIGTSVELEGLTYNFNASVIDVRIK
jgi:hypothetical protein